jgi:hypothetical protein
MRKNGIGWIALGLLLSASVVACKAAPATSTSDKDLTKDPKSGDPSSSGSNTPAAPAGSSSAAPPAGAAVAAAKIHDAPVLQYVATKDALFLATDTQVLKTGLDGAAPTPQPALAGASLLATDGTRVYALLDKGDVADLVSVKADGTDPKQHAEWSKVDGEPASLSVQGGLVFLGVTSGIESSQTGVSSIAATAVLGDGTPWQLRDGADAQALPPAFDPTHLFTVDYARDAIVREPLAANDFSPPVDVLIDEFPTSAGGLASDATDVYTRTNAGIVKFAVGSGEATAPVVVVPAATCPILDPGTGVPSSVVDMLAIDGTTIYTACRAAGNVEIRSYGKDGKQIKVVGALPFAGGVSHLRVGTSAVYWLNVPAAGSTSAELWRGPK